ncbi:hypothetical protein BIV57_13270 [Mangrovactinospora gilvigrisea]|uniref:DUF4123 domain-containing protein n=1 Tax=Mangrovactinospora gilvigrisea TaxID=1428644 RepID=A0A1J7BEA1_9ACTN|nr:hypothetical protein [Mangrovactinospora gilvigrisea]OIV36958.1 hypothetical protein BIV57_13270 [Mangrovactinospora gilvigrisea]
MTLVLLTDHPGWDTPAEGDTERLLFFDGRLRLLQWDGAHLRDRILDQTRQSDPRLKPTVPLFRTSAARLPARLPQPVRDALSGLTWVVRVPNPSLWDAITASLIRTACPAPVTARAAYRLWCRLFGAVQLPDDTLAHCTPAPATVLHLTPHDANRARLERLLEPLQLAAHLYLRRAGSLERMTGHALITCLRRDGGLGHTPAAWAAADYSGDLSVHPLDSQLAAAIRRLDPTYAWPAEPRALATEWTALGPTPRELSALNLFALAAHSTAGSEGTPCAHTPNHH